MPKFDRTRLLFGLYLLVLITAFELLIRQLKVPGWPGYVGMIFFFVENMDVKKAPSIIVGGVFGIALILLARPIIGALAPLIGLELAGIAFVLALVYAIVAFGEMVPLLFNNYAFMYLTVTGVAVMQPDPNPFLWMGITAIGGSALIAGVVGIGRLMMAQAASKQAAASTTSSA
jgi:hypothetical protein